METISETSSSHSNARLTAKQQEFICRKIAAFMPLSDIAHTVLAEFPKSRLAYQQVYNKVRHIAATKKTDKWRRKIESYRSELRKQPLSRFAVANTFERVRILQQLIDFASQPRISRVIWFPSRRDPDGSMHYDKREIWEPNYHAAMRGIMLVNRELNKNGAGNSPLPDNGNRKPTS